ncbi:hypothetical protein C2G38_2231765 [Gigaspora rosea]|uniref:Uncharacterized protein n=1 Tax=Gigaspora rosea TaxID=44941 RepID=A0A397TWM3_9GLOM|nr:hypothetical protein C2G38_2231765 [Gigaspora rosea]
MSLGFFIIVNNNNRSRLVGQALMNNETVESYEWFNYLRDNLLTKFSNASSYLNHALFGKKECWALCHTSKIFTAEMQSTQHVAGQNGIIKNSVNSSSTLIYASSEFSPKIDKWITSYLTPITLSIQRQEIAQAIWYTSRLINFQNLGFNSIEQADLIKQSDLNEEFNLTEESDTNRIFDTFVKDIVNAPATLVKKLISTTEVELIHEVWECGFVCRYFFQVMKVSNYASFHIMLISKRWYVDEKQIEQESQTRLHPFIIGLNDSMNSETSIHTEQYFPDSSFHLPTIPFNETHSKVNYHKAYVTINGLSKKAIQAGLDASSSTIQELEDFINGFITKHALKKKDKKNKRQHNDENKPTSDYSSSNKDFIAIENLVVHSKRGASRKKVLKVHLN